MISLAFLAFIWGLLVIGVLVAEYFALSGFFQINSELKYWVGLSGGISMLIALVYPIRKYLLPDRGKLNWWLDLHLIFGFAGVLLISFHNNLKIRALVPSSTYALMLLVVVTGIIGRFLYGKVNLNYFRYEMLSRQKELSPVENDELAVLRKMSDKLAVIRTIHYSATMLMVGLAIVHILSIHYTRGNY